MRVLFLTCHLPYPPFSGGRRREYELLARLARTHEVDVLAVSKTPEEDRRQADALRGQLGQVTVLGAEPPRGNFTSRLAPQVARHRSPVAEAHLAEALTTRGHDLLHVEGFYLVQHVPAASRAPIVLAEQNVEYEIWRQRASIASGADAEALRAAADRTRAEELRAWTRADVLVAVTHEDRAAIRTASGRTDVRVVPDGADHSSVLEHGVAAGEVPPPPRGGLVMVGNFAYEPSVAGAKYLINDILPRVRAARPETPVTLVGNSPPPELAQARGVTVTGRVPAVEPYLDAADVVVCPLRSGGGVKVKMLEALSRGKAIVATPVSAQGLGRAARHAVRVCERPEDLAAEIVDLLARPEERRRLERAARAFAARLPTWDHAAAALEDAWRAAAFTRAARTA